MRLRPLFAALALLAAPARAGEPGKDAAPVTPLAAPATPLSDMMLDVQRVQARMALGDRDAYAEQRARLRAVGQALAAAGADAFKVKAERDAAVLYLLSGGQPKDVAKIAARGDFPDAERDLLLGAEGYTAGRTTDAEKLLPYDAHAQSLRLASQLAYAQSVLLAPRDAGKALDLLDLARLLAPGTLIEEAALRREIMLVGDLRHADRVAFLARQYVERFGRSIYAGDFVRALAAAAIRFDLCATPADLAKFSALLELTPPEQGRAFLLEVGRAALLRGGFEVAVGAAEGALKTAEAGSTDEARARLYAFAARFPGAGERETTDALAAIAADRLGAPDRALLAAAAYVHGRLYDPPPPRDYEEAWREAAVAAARSPNLPADPPDAPTATLRRAETALAAAEALGVPEGR